MFARFLVAVLASLTAVACTFDTRVVSTTDAAPIDAAIDAGTAPEHLLLSEIKTSNDALLREFIEIFNPTSQTIDLRNYYLADDAIYARLPAIAAGEPGAVLVGDFVARFPAGAEIEPGEVLVIAIRTSVEVPFLGASFAVAPGDNTPPMDEAFAGSIRPPPDLANDDGEGIALFFWDGQSDVVRDVDLFNGGFQIAPQNALANKTGLSIDGPDADDIVTAYAPDGYSMPLPPRSNGVNEAFVRIAAEIDEPTSGGNGLGGHDETSENINASWGFASETPGSTTLSF